MDASTNEYNFAVYNSSDGGSTWSYVANVASSTTAATGGAYSYAATGLTPGTSYQWRVYAVSEGKYSAALSGTQSTTTCGTYSGTMTVGPTGTFSSLTSAVATLVTCGYTGNIALELQSTYVSTVETFPITFPSGLGSSGKSITIRPELGATPIITTNNATGTIFINGADYIIFDGRPAGTGTPKTLNIINTTTSAYVIKIDNDAVNNTFQYCTIKGVTASATIGTINIGSVAPSTGNDNNTIDNNDILDGASTPYMHIYSAGNTTTTAQYNDNLVITNNNIANFYVSSGGIAYGVYLNTGTSGATVSGNSVYQSASRATSGASTFNCIYISNSGSGFTVNNNYIGGTAALAGSTALTVTGANANTFTGIYLSTATTTTNTIQNNTIANFAFTSSSTGVAFVGIYLNGGNHNVGTATKNVFGSQTGTGNITFTQSGSSGASVYPIYIVSGTNTVSNNEIGSVTMTTLSANTLITNFQGIRIGGGTNTVSNNFIGGTTSNSIQGLGGQNATATAVVMYGIGNAVIAGSITGNTIRNIAYAAPTGGTGPSTGMQVAGIYASSSSAAITGNTISNLSSIAGNTGTITGGSVIGIADASSGSTENISQNTISGLSNTYNGTSVTNVIGIATSSTCAGTMARNKIYNISNASTATTTPFAAGMYLTSTGTWTISNNMIRIVNGGLTNGMQCAGIIESATGTRNYYYNTVYVGGSQASGSLNSVAFQRGSSATMTIKNNIFDMQRTNTGAATGKFYAIANTNGTPATGWPANVSDYNVLNSSNTATVGVWGVPGAGDKDFAGWKSSSSGDNSSVSGISVPYFDLANNDLHMTVSATATPVESGGVVISGVTDDIDAAAVRTGYPLGSQVNGGGTAPDIGCDEFDGAPKDQSAPGISYTTLASTCSSANITLSGVTITDGSGVPTTGTLMPRIYYRKGAGAWFSQAGTLTSGTSKNGQWSFTIVNSDMGGVASGDVISYYVIAQDIASPANIGSTPGTGLVATDVNTVGTAPTTPNTYSILATLSGLYSVGASNIGGEAGPLRYAYCCCYCL